jgi:hypothetical protein
MNETTTEWQMKWEDGFEDWRADAAPVLGRRHRLAMVVGVAGIRGGMTTAMVTAHAAPRIIPAGCPAAATTGGAR